MRIIKKYPNRRLYDTTISSYITLDDVKRLVLNCVPFQVVDARTGDDLTHSTLLQIITEQEGSETPIFTTDILQQLIRFYGNSMQTMMSGFLEQTLAFMSKQQTEVHPLLDKTPLNLMTELAERNMALWKKWQESFYSTASPQTPSPMPATPSTDPAD